MLKQRVHFEASKWLQAYKYPAILGNTFFILYKKCTKMFQQKKKKRFFLKAKEDSPWFLLIHCYSCIQRRWTQAVRRSLLYLQGSGDGEKELPSILFLGAPQVSNSHFCFTNSLCIAIMENSWKVSDISVYKLFILPNLQKLFKSSIKDWGLFL